MSGVKYDGAKPRYDLIPPDALERLAELYALGAKKYGERNWEEGMTWGRIFAALMRHAWAFWRGEKYDQIDGQHHLIAVAWNAFVLYEYEQRQIGEDNRKVNRNAKKD